MNFLDNDDKYLRAQERVSRIKKFYSSLISYVLVISFLGALNYYTNEWRHPWFLWAAFGWGIGLVFHALKAFGWNPLFGKEWEERKIREIMEEEDQKGRWQ